MTRAHLCPLNRLLVPSKIAKITLWNKDGQENFLTKWNANLAWFTFFLQLNVPSKVKDLVGTKCKLCNDSKYIVYFRKCSEMGANIQLDYSKKLTKMVKNQHQCKLVTINFYNSCIMIRYSSVGRANQELVRIHNDAAHEELVEIHNWLTSRKS